MSKKAKWGIAGGIALLLVAAVGVTAARGNNKGTEVRIEGVETRDLVASVTASGQIQPRTKVDLSSDITGRITRLAVEEGQMVTKGQFLLRIDPAILAALQRWADDELRSLNGQIEFVLRRVLQDEGRLNDPRHPPLTDGRSDT